MKRTLLYIISGCLSLVGCRQEDSFLDNAGRVKLGVGIDDEIEIVASRSVLSEEETTALKENCKIRIFNNGKLVNRYGRWSEVPEDGILMPVGDKYSTLVVAGDSVPASFESKYYKGTETFVVAKGQTKTVEVNCNIVNTLVKIEYSEDWDNLLEEAKVTVSVDGGSLEYSMEDEGKIGYFIAPEKNPVIKCVFSGKTKTGKTFSYPSTIESVKEATLYTVKYSPSDGEPVPGNYGGGFFELTVDETPLHTESETVMVYQRPVISATNGSENIDLSSDMFVATGATMSPVFTFSGSTPLKSVVVESELLSQLGLSSNYIDIIAEQQPLVEIGWNVTITEDKKKVTLEFSDKLNTFFETESLHSMKFVATDTYDEIQEGATAKTREAVWNIIVSDANVASIDIPSDRRYEIWSDKAVFYGQKLKGKTLTETLYFRYREKDTDTWSENIPAIIDDVYYKTEQVKGLKPGTTYQYQMVEGAKPSNAISEVTTDQAAQFPNKSFEDWFQDGKTWYIYNRGGQMFWDSGNQGGTTGIASWSPYNMTTAATDYSFSGKSVKMVNKVIANTLAAGNLFIGDFIGTEDTTKGILGWGRPWSTRPKALRGYVRYIPNKVTNDKLPDGDDDGIIYIAIGDWTGVSYDKSNWPIIIRTKYPDTNLFYKEVGTYTGNGIIGYGELVLYKETKGEDGGMYQFEIPIKYRSLERLPKSIVVVASASKYGDYYIGADGSTMWLDELELVYGDVELEDSNTLN